MAINSRTKGASGEREFCDWLQKNFNLITKPTRELGQARDEGCDVILYPFAFEVKRRESLDLLSWWTQVKRAVNNQEGKCFGFEPVVAFRQNGFKWEFLIAGEHIGIEGGWIRLTELAFKKWVVNYLHKIQVDGYNGKHSLNFDIGNKNVGQQSTQRIEFVSN